jgi:acetyl esterase/lipase
MRAPILMLFVSSILVACDDGATDGATGGAGSTTSNAAQGSSGQTSNASGSSASGSGTSGSGSSTTSSTGSGMAAPDPDKDGPFTTTTITDTVQNMVTNHSIPIRCAYPTGGPDAGPYPVIVVAHGFQLPPSQYASYVDRLASFGYVALTADFPAGFTGTNHVNNAKDLLAALDWAGAEPALVGIADANTAGLTGHSLGGKLSLLAATMDPRVKATINLDPVDGAMNCSAQNCPDVSMLMPLPIPTGFLGETTDAAGGFMSCAPAADNYATFYAGTTGPSVSVTVNGANHMSFLDDVATCGFTCSFCNAATAPNATVNALSKAFVTAFYERWLKGRLAYDAYLTGDVAKARYVDTNLATIQSK